MGLGLRASGSFRADRPERLCTAKHGVGSISDADRIQIGVSKGFGDCCPRRNGIDYHRRGIWQTYPRDASTRCTSRDEKRSSGCHRAMVVDARQGARGDGYVATRRGTRGRSGRCGERTYDRGCTRWNYRRPTRFHPAMMGIINTKNFFSVAARTLCAFVLALRHQAAFRFQGKLRLFDWCCECVASCSTVTRNGTRREGNGTSRYAAERRR